MVEARTDEKAESNANSFFLVACAGFASMVGMRICDALLPDLADSFQVTDGVAAGSISMFVIAYGFLQLVYGPLGDRYGKQRVISFAVAASALINLALVFAPSMFAIIVLRGLAGAATAGIIPLSMAFIGDTVPYAERQGVLAKFMSATIIGMIFGQWVGGLFADVLNWQAAFGLLFLIFGGVAIMMLRALPARPVADSTKRSFIAQMASVLRISWARRILLIALIEGAFVFSALVFIPTYLHNRFGVPLTAAGAIVALYGAGGLVYTFFARRLLGRFGERGLALNGGFLMGIGFALLAFGPHWAWAIPACLIAGLGFYMLHNTLQANATQMAPHTRGTAVSLFACCLFLGQSLGIGAISAMVDHYGADTAFVVSMVALPLLGIWFARSLSHKPLSPVTE
ncbi:MFS transporter [Candidimonas sp. SYP-B2681]|uniref:MFS transporter n=1 Tax=Candidimonas sp. SYP-B2681 TaxID=2497686 RepID=UPI001F1D4FA9|nr:MFS transporter [Candidimonas sp. SYP-B2681]